eukprot:1189772-Prorocentrum_minimum.AAC.3
MVLSASLPLLAQEGPPFVTVGYTHLPLVARSLPLRHAHESAEADQHLEEEVPPALGTGGGGVVPEELPEEREPLRGVVEAAQRVHKLADARLHVPAEASQF